DPKRLPPPTPPPGSLAATFGAPKAVAPKGPPPPPRTTAPPPTAGSHPSSGAPPRLPPPPPAAATARATPPGTAAALPNIPGMSEPELRALHQRYVDAQKQSGAAAAVKYETLVNSLAKQVPNVLRQPGVRGVRFDVSVQDGKPVLKAIPQK